MLSTTFAQQLEYDNEKINEILQYNIWELSKQNDDEIEFTYDDLLSPFADYSMQITCMQLAENNAKLSDFYFKKWSLSKIYENLAVKLSINYKPEKKENE